MGFFTRAAMDALMKTTHPEINRRQCWNLHPHRKSCTACKDICPYGDQIFTRPNLVKDWDPCTDCGLCVSVCRSRCISPSPEQVERDTSAADTDNDTIWIGCEKSVRKNSMVRACIASLSWEALAYLALNKKIVLDLTPCGECENDTCADQLRADMAVWEQRFGNGVTLWYSYTLAEVADTSSTLGVPAAQLGVKNLVVRVPSASTMTAEERAALVQAQTEAGVEHVVVRDNAAGYYE
jgi:NAD-dependent dihydropyrimidine dehydrogenase PreA subunit